MKIERKDIEISLDQLFELFSHDPDSLKNLLNDADCRSCLSTNALIDYRIILTAANRIRLEGRCRFCRNQKNNYKAKTPGISRYYDLVGWKLHS